MTTSVCTEAIDGTDRRWLSQYGQINGVKYERAIPGGDTNFTCNYVVGPKFHSLAVAPGRLLTAWCAGQLAWAGILEMPEPSSDGLKLQAIGTSALSDKYDAITGGNAMYIDDNIDACIARGLPWTRLNNTPGLYAYIDPGCTLRTALTKAVELTGQYWYVTSEGKFFWLQLPTTPMYQLAALSEGGGRTLNEVYTDIAAAYTNNSGTRTLTGFTGNTKLRDKIGRSETVLDMTSAGNQPAGSPPSSVTTRINAAIAKQGQRASWSNGWVAPRGTLRASGGGLVEPALVLPSQRVSVMLADVGMWGEADPTPIEFNIGQTAYDMDADNVTLTPVETKKSDLLSELSR